MRDSTVVQCLETALHCMLHDAYFEPCMSELGNNKQNHSSNNFLRLLIGIHIFHFLLLNIWSLGDLLIYDFFLGKYLYIISFEN